MKGPARRSWGIVTSFGLLCASLAALPAAAGTTSEEILATFKSRLRKASDTLAREPVKNARALADVGIAQVRLQDLEGASKTLLAIPADKRVHSDDFVEQLTSRQAAAGDVAGALKTVASVHWGIWYDAEARALLAVGREAARAGQKTEAETAITRAAAAVAQMRDDDWQHIALFKIALAQVEAGFPEGARKTFRELEHLTELLSKAAHRRAHALCRMGTLSARLGDLKAAQKYFAAAIAAIAVYDGGGGPVQATIAIAQAEAGDPIGGMVTALNDPRRLFGSWSGGERDRALHGIVLARLSQGDRARAQQTADEIAEGQWSRHYHTAALFAIAESYARAGEMRRAIVVAERMEEGSRKAQALLGIAALMAQRGDKPAARRLADGITFLRSQDHLMRQFGKEKRFRFADHTTWDYPYESTGGFTMASARANRDIAGDVTAAAMRCRVALDGQGGEIDREVAEGWQVDKVARAQAAAGDAQGVLAWMDRLPEAKKLQALLGAADGLALLRDERARLRQRKD
jgi:hypothetical protein